jgi:hypothetical protein
MSNKYILEGRETRPVSLEEWAKWFETGNRRVGQDTVGDKLVSTVFLGLDHSFGEPRPILFETMVFPHGSWSEEYCARYSTYNEAEAGHKAVVEALQKGEPLPC